ncbi:MAG: formate transporter FocA [Anaerolineae bacterium]|nr:formate transporter FocA [Anaerolineae bacterium]
MAENPFDALLPREIAERAEVTGEARTALDAITTLGLATLAGGFISMGAVFSTTVATGSSALPFGVARLLVGLAFCLGLILVVVAGAELFTGNNLIIMAWASGRVTTRRLLRNWGLVYAGNFFGSVITAVLVVLARYHFGGGTAVGLQALRIAEAKCSLGLVQAIALGMLCNALVCIAVWLIMGGHSTTDKILATIFPISAFVASGFEHSVANMYFIPVGLLIKSDAAFLAAAGVAASEFPHLTLTNFLFVNLLPVTIGNIIGGSVMVGLAYWSIYLRPARVRRQKGPAAVGAVPARQHSR